MQVQRGQDVRRRIDLVEEAATVGAVKDASESPRLVLERLHVHDLDEEQIAGLGAFDLKRTGEIVDPGQVNVSHVVGRVIISNLAASPTLKGQSLVLGVVYHTKQVETCQSRHSILTVSPSLIVPANGTGRTVSTWPDTGENIHHTVWMPSILGRLLDPFSCFTMDGYVTRLT